APMAQTRTDRGPGPPVPNRPPRETPNALMDRGFQPRVSESGTPPADFVFLPRIAIRRARADSHATLDPARRPRRLVRLGLVRRLLWPPRFRVRVPIDPRLCH